jgi:ATPase subunit of ABC transporter with duplicated ATPase domains
MSANAKAKDRIAQLEEFVRRFRAHKSKARQATSRMKQIDRLKVEDVKPSSRQYPFIRFEYDEKDKLHRLALEVEALPFAYEADSPVIRDFSIQIEAGEKVAIVGENGVGKTMLLCDCWQASCRAGASSSGRRRHGWATARRTTQRSSLATSIWSTGSVAVCARAATRGLISRR